MFVTCTYGCYNGLVKTPCAIDETADLFRGVVSPCMKRYLFVADDLHLRSEIQLFYSSSTHLLYLLFDVNRLLHVSEDYMHVTSEMVTSEMQLTPLSNPQNRSGFDSM